MTRNAPSGVVQKRREWRARCDPLYQKLAQRLRTQLPTLGNAEATVLGTWISAAERRGDYRVLEELAAEIDLLRQRTQDG